MDTSKFRQQSKAEEQQPSTPLTPRKEKNESSSLYKEVALREKEAALRQKFSKLDREGGRKTAPSALRQSKEQYSKTIDDNRMESAVKSWAKDKNVGSMNEFAQTNLDKGVADSAPEAPVSGLFLFVHDVPIHMKYQQIFLEWLFTGKAILYKNVNCSNLVYIHVLHVEFICYQNIFIASKFSVNKCKT